MKGTALFTVISFIFKKDAIAVYVINSRGDQDVYYARFTSSRVIYLSGLCVNKAREILDSHRGYKRKVELRI